MIEVRFIEALESAEEWERRGAAAEIGESSDPEAFALLVGALGRETTRAAKEAILRAISGIWTTATVQPIIELLRDNDPFVRAEAVEMLQHNADKVVTSLGELMRGSDKDLRKFSVDILSKSATGVPDALYLEALKDEDINVVISTIENIGAARRAGFLEPILELALHHTQPMVVCACLETLALMGTQRTLNTLRSRFPDAEDVSGILFHPFLKLLGTTAGPKGCDEICRVIASRGKSAHEVGIDAVAQIVARHNLTQMDAFCERVLCNQLVETLEERIRLRLVHLLGRFTASSRIAFALLPYIFSADRALGLAAVDSLGNSCDPAVVVALRSLMATEDDPETRTSLQEIVGRRPQWNLQQNSFQS